MGFVAISCRMNTFLSLLDAQETRVQMSYLYRGWLKALVQLRLGLSTRWAHHTLKMPGRLDLYGSP